MSNIKAFIDYSMEDNGSSAREALYADIHDRVMSAIEAKKMELAGGMLTRESRDAVSENVNEKLLKAESKVARLKEELALMEAAMCDSDDDDDDDDSEYKEKKKKLKKAKKKSRKELEKKGFSRGEANSMVKQAVKSIASKKPMKRAAGRGG